MLKRWLNIFIYILCLPLYSFTQDCNCINCPEEIADDSTTEIIFSVNSASNNDLSGIEQGVCEVFIKFNHSYIGDLTMDLVSPAGQTVNLIGPFGSASPTFLASFNLTFIACAETAMPDPGNTVNWNNLNISGLGNYNGFYYPYQGCLENFNTGTVNGEWKLIVTDHDAFDVGNLIDLHITFCDPLGIECCEANGGELDGELMSCSGDENLNITMNPVFDGPAPLSNLYDYTYLIIENDLIIGLENEPDLRNYLPGQYEICGLSYSIEDQALLPSTFGVLSINDLRLQLEGNSAPFCGDVSSTCIEVVISEPPVLNEISDKLCPLDSIPFAGEFILAEGIYYDTVTLLSNCDSITILTVEALKNDTTYGTAYTCNSDLEGIDTMLFSNLAGCDSIHIQNTVLNNSDTTFTSTFTCDFSLSETIDTFVLDGINCDSVVINNYHFIESDTTFQTAFTCSENEAGIDTSFLQNIYSCDSLVVLETVFQQDDTTYIDLTTCDPAQAGMEVEVYASEFCDSIVIVKTELLKSDTTLLEEIVCDAVQGMPDTLFLLNQFDCDSLIITEKIIVDPDTTFLQEVSCEFEGIDTTFLSNQNGCDSLIITETRLEEIDITRFTDYSCEEQYSDTMVLSGQFCDSLIITDYTFIPVESTMLLSSSCDPNEVGVDTFYYSNQFNCDSLVIVETEFSAVDTNYVMLGSTCDSELAGMDTLIFQTELCDSVVISTLTFVPIDTTFLESGVCFGESLETEINLYTSSQFCDSIVQVSFFEIPADTSFIFIPTSVPENEGVDTAFLSNILGCDSLVITTTFFQTTIPDTSYININTCDINQIEPETIQVSIDLIEIYNFIYSGSDNVYLQDYVCTINFPEIDTLFLVNGFGCDSLIITNNIYSQPTFTYFTETSCDPLGIGLDTLIQTDQYGCDSFEITETLFVEMDTIFKSEFICDLDAEYKDTILLDGTDCPTVQITSFSNGNSPLTEIIEETCEKDTASETIVFENQLGCDSIVLVNYSSNFIDTMFIEESTCKLDEVSLEVFNYQSQFGCDSIIVLSTIFQLIDTVFTEWSTCKLDEIGVDTLLDSTGDCDKVIIASTLYDPIETTFIETNTCVEEDAGVFEATFISSEGCDSLVVYEISWFGLLDTLYSEQLTCNLIEQGYDTLLIDELDCPYIEIVQSIFEATNDTSYQTLASCDPILVGTSTVENFPSSDGCDSLVLTSYIEGSGQVEYSVSTQGVSCFGGNDGNATIESFTEGLQISWQDGYAEFFRDELASGDYFVTLSTGACELLEKITISSPEKIISSVMVSNNDCSSNSGSLSASASGGIPPFQYKWSNNEFGQTLENLSNGTYLLTICDSAGCSTVHQAEVRNVEGVDIEIESTDVSCFGRDDGYIISRVLSGTAPLLFKWSTGETTQNLASLSPGRYDLTVLDLNDCEFYDSIIIEEPPLLEVELEISSTEIVAKASGGSPPYLYLWNTGEIGDRIIDPIEGEIYMVSVRDSNNCLISKQEFYTSIQNFDHSKLDVYPNPSTGVFYISSNQLKMADLDIKMYDSLGKLMDIKTNHNNLTFELINPSQGSYFLEISTGLEIYRFKLIILK